METATLVSQVDTKTIISKTIEITKSFQDKNDMTELDMTALTNSIYEVIDQRITQLLNEKHEQLSVEEYEDFADLIISLADIQIVGFLKQYAMDCTEAPYLLSQYKLNKLKRNYTKKIMLGKPNALINELSSMIFSIIYIPCFIKAKVHREKELSKNKQ